MSRIYALTATGNRGKTATLTELTHLFPHWFSISRAISDFHPGDDVGCCEYEGGLVGVLTDSDRRPNDPARAALTELVRQGCEVIFCAARTYARGGSVNGALNCDNIPTIATDYELHRIDQCVIHTTSGKIVTPHDRRLVANRNRHMAELLKALI